MELAKLSNGEITGIDINQSSLNELNKKIENNGFSDRMKVLNCSLMEIENTEKPVIAVLNGYCLGSGYELALA
ncbi:MAG: hypothetical protein ACW981_14825 [Candidatus Hodarchaeales archaeon]